MPPPDKDNQPEDRSLVPRPSGELAKSGEEVKSGELVKRGLRDLEKAAGAERLHTDEGKYDLDTCLNIYVGNLSFSWGEEEVRELFSAYGEVYRVKAHVARDGTMWGLVLMETSRANVAIEALNGTEHGGRVLRVNEAYTKGWP